MHWEIWREPTNGDDSQGWISYAKSDEGKPFRNWARALGVAASYARFAPEIDLRDLEWTAAPDQNDPMNFLIGGWGSDRGREFVILLKTTYNHGH